MTIFTVKSFKGADIIMQLDDVVQTTHTNVERIKEATERTSRWLDRCISAHQKPEEQNVFPIVQGLLSSKYREQSAREHIKKDVNGFAIGGLRLSILILINYILQFFHQYFCSGGEAKDDFWPMVDLSTNILPEDKPRYLMGVGMAVDLVVCVALGVDMFDCVFPTRTAVIILFNDSIWKNIDLCGISEVWMRFSKYGTIEFEAEKI